MKQLTKQVLQLFLVATVTTMELLQTVASLVSGGHLLKALQQLHGVVLSAAPAMMFSESSA